MVSHILQALGTRRHNPGGTLRSNLVLYLCQTAIHLLVGSLGNDLSLGCSCCTHGDGCQEGTQALVSHLCLSFCLGSSLRSWLLNLNGLRECGLHARYGKLIAQSTKLTLLQTVSAGNTTAVVNGMRLVVDTRGLAVPGTHAAVLALLGVESHMEEREAGEEAQHGAHRTDGVAIGAAVTPCQIDDDDKGNHGDDEGGQCLEPHIHIIHGIALVSLSDGSQHVVAPAIERLEQVAGNTSV